MKKEEEQFIDLIKNSSRKEINQYLKEYVVLNGPLSQEALDNVKNILDSRPFIDPEPLIVSWKDYTAISDRYAEFKILKNGRMIYHTSSMVKAPKDENECLEILKEILENIKLLAEQKHCY